MGSLRVIAGIARGRKLRPVPGDTTRPITDRTKESLFNIIGNDIRGASFLDLFSGTGSVGIEALSRGAARILFVDKIPQAIHTIHANLENSGLKDLPGVEIRRQDAFTLLKTTPEQRFDYIYIAPPQYKSLWKKALTEVDGNPAWLSPDAWVIVQIHPIEYEQTELKNLKEFDTRKYGSTLLVFYECIEDPANPAL
jgi:16S rRNA (guanine(966)-N(2))-methyltransferase RsmD